MSAPRLRAYRVHVRFEQTLAATVTATSERDAYDQALEAIKAGLPGYKLTSTNVTGPFIKCIDDEEMGQ